MPHRALMSSALRTSVCWALIAFCWLALWLALRGLLRDTLLLFCLPILLVWSCVLPRNQRALAWLCWGSILVILFLAIWLPVR